jgi:hypothetical protein
MMFTRWWNRRSKTGRWVTIALVIFGLLAAVGSMAPPPKDADQAAASQTPVPSPSTTQGPSPSPSPSPLPATTATPTEAPTSTPPSPQPSPTWNLTVDGVRYTTEAFVGGDITVAITLSNDGTIANPGTKLQFETIDKYADLQGCTPKCEVNNFFGVFATEPGVGPAKTVTDRIVWVATRVGVAQWSVCVYDSNSGGQQIYCGNGTTTIR